METITVQPISNIYSTNIKMETITLQPISDRSINKPIDPITVHSSEQIKTKKVWLKDKRGFKRVVKLKRFVSTGITCILLDGNYAKSCGFSSREDMVTQGHYDDANGKHELLHHPETDKVYALLKQQCS